MNFVVALFLQLGDIPYSWQYLFIEYTAVAYVKNKKTDCLAGPWATWAMGMFLNCVNPCNILLCYEIFVTNDQHTQNYCM